MADLRDYAAGWRNWVACFHATESPVSTSWRYAPGPRIIHVDGSRTISRVQLVRGVGVSEALESELDVLKVGYVEDEAGGAAIAQPMEVYSSSMCTGC